MPRQYAIVVIIIVTLLGLILAYALAKSLGVLPVTPAQAQERPASHALSKEQVIALQLFLKTENCLGNWVKLTGHYGDLTRAAVKRWKAGTCRNPDRKAPTAIITDVYRTEELKK